MAVRYFCDICKKELTTPERYFISFTSEDKRGCKETLDILMSDHNCYWKVRGFIASLDPEHQKRFVDAL